jgi:ubiquinone/menaquinone biosynthesis C-methylase UbiE
MNKYLPARGHYFQNSIVPSLPLPDASIDLIYCGSVFTHMDEFEESWLLEFRRVLKPGGIAFITVLTERTWADLKPGHPVLQHLTSHPYGTLESETNPVTAEWFNQPMPAERIVFRYMPSPFHNMHTFLKTSYIREKWGRCFEVQKILSHAHGFHQDGVLLAKRR